jgi:hypothetical protein
MHDVYQTAGVNKSGRIRTIRAFKPWTVSGFLDQFSHRLPQMGHPEKGALSLLNWEDREFSLK